MIVKGKARQNGKQLGKYLVVDALKVNEQIKVLEIKGTTSRDPQKALLEMSLAAELTKGKLGLYHASINPDTNQDQGMTDKDFLKAADLLEEELKLVGQNRVIVLHEKAGRVHAHVVWQREKKGKLLTTSRNYEAHDRARGRIEQELKHSRTRQPQDTKKELSQIWEQSRDGADFITQAKAKGYKIGRGYMTESGKIRPYSVTDKNGLMSDLSRQIINAKTGQIKERLKEIEISLPDTANHAGQKPQKDRQNERKRRTRAAGRERVFAGEKEINVRQEQPPRQVAIEARQAFDDIIKPISEPKRPLTEAEIFARKLALMRENQLPEEGRAPELQDNKKSIENDIRQTPKETDFDRRLRQARENLKRDDFGHEHTMD